MIRPKLRPGLLQCEFPPRWPTLACGGGRLVFTHTSSAKGPSTVGFHTQNRPNPLRFVIKFVFVGTATKDITSNGFQSFFLNSFAGQCPPKNPDPRPSEMEPKWQPRAKTGVEGCVFPPFRGVQTINSGGGVGGCPRPKGGPEFKFGPHGPRYGQVLVFGS